MESAAVREKLSLEKQRCKAVGADDILIVRVLAVGRHARRVWLLHGRPAKGFSDGCNAPRGAAKVAPRTGVVLPLSVRLMSGALLE